MKYKKLTFNRLFELADQKKSVLWVSRQKNVPAAFMQNWNARLLKDWFEKKWLVEVK